MKLGGTISAILQEKKREIFSIAPDATVFDAIRLMSEKNVGALLVMKGSKLAGVISERDYTRNVILKGRSSQQTAVSEVMTQKLITVAPSDSVDVAMRTVTDHRVRHLPVVEEGNVVGVVSIGDLVRWTISAQSATIDQLQDFIAGKYPG